MPTVRTLAGRIAAVASLAAASVAAMEGSSGLAAVSQVVEGGIPLGAVTAALVMTAAGRRIGATGRWPVIRLRLCMSAGWVLAVAVVVHHLLDPAVTPLDLASALLGD